MRLLLKLNLLRKKYPPKHLLPKPLPQRKLSLLLLNWLPRRSKLAQSVATPMEEQLSGVDNLNYMYSLNAGASGQMTEEYVLAVLDALKSQYKIGDVYLLGFSQGCALTYLTGLHHPELFKGIICFGGWLQQDRVTLAQMQAAKGLRVFIGQLRKKIEPDPTRPRYIHNEHGFGYRFFPTSAATDPTT